MSSSNARRAENQPAPLSDLANKPPYESFARLEGALTLRLDPRNILIINKLIDLYRLEMEDSETAMAGVSLEDALRATLDVATPADRARAAKIRDIVRAMQECRRVSAVRVAWFKDRKERLEKAMHFASSNQPEEFRSQMQDVIPSFWLSATRLPRMATPSTISPPA